MLDSLYRYVYCGLTKSLVTRRGLRCIDYIPCNLTGLDYTQFPHRVISGQILCQVEVGIQVSVRMEDRIICFSAFVLGREVGRQEVFMADH